MTAITGEIRLAVVTYDKFYSLYIGEVEFRGLENTRKIIKYGWTISSI